jgi:hypothetical protein
LIGDNLLSLDKNAFIHRYLLPDNMPDQVAHFGAVFPYDRLFYANNKAGRIPASIANVGLPDQAALKEAADIKPDDLYSWHPGMTVSLSLDVVGDDAFRKQQLDLWTSALKDNGITIDDSSPNKLAARSFLIDGSPTEYSIRKGFGPNATVEKVSVQNKVVGHEIILKVGEKELWKDVYNKAPDKTFVPMSIFLEIKAGETPQQAAERLYPPPKTASVVAPPPKYLFKERAIGISRLGPNGILPERATPTPTGAPSGAPPIPGRAPRPVRGGAIGG